jgi:hypothetical protein
MENKMEEKPNISRNNAPPKTPAWAKAFFIVILLLILVVIIAHLMGLRFDHGGVSALFSISMSRLNVLYIL